MEPELSILIPILNERDSLRALHEKLTKVLHDLGRTYEIIFVDDGSSDDSVLVCQELVRQDIRVVLVELRRNFGKAMALQIGFQIAQGDIIITMDGDLQDDPEEIPRFLAALAKEYDVVSGWKQSRQDPISKIVLSGFFNFFTSRVTGISLHDFNCGFKAYRREVVVNLDLYGELHRYIPVLAHTRGYRVGEIPVRHHPRRHGRSKYGSKRVLRGAFDLLTVVFLSTFRYRPLHLFGLIGLVFSVVGFVIDLYLTTLWFLGTRPIGNRPLLTLGTLLIVVGVQLLGFGLLSEMLTAVTYRRSDTVDLIRQVHRRQTPTKDKKSILD